MLLVFTRHEARPRCFTLGCQMGDTWVIVKTKPSQACEGTPMEISEKDRAELLAIKEKIDRGEKLGRYEQTRWTGTPASLRREISK